MGQVLALYVSRAGVPLQFSIAAARAISGVGLEGDTKSLPDGHILLITQEAIDQVNRATRTNIRFDEIGCHVLLERVDLDVLLHRKFVIGEVTLEGIELSRPGIKGVFSDKSQLRAEILKSGVIKKEDPVVLLEF